MLKVGILGALGRMGQEMAHCIREGHLPITLAAAGIRPGHPYAGHDYGDVLGLQPFHIILEDNCHTVFQHSDIVIDFSTIQALSETYRVFEKNPRPWVVGVTGFNNQEMLEQAACLAPVFYSANMSLGIAILKHLVREATKYLPSDYQVHIMDAHHHMKKDSPSGTALDLAKEVSLGQKSYKTHTLNLSSIRAGGVIGDHDVHFISMHDKLTLHHQAFSRRSFAEGALKAACWLVKQPLGFYTMEDIVKS